MAWGQGQVLPFTLQNAGPTSHDKEYEHHDKGVSKVESGGERTRDGRLIDKIVNGEEKEVEGCGACREERPPPPTIVLRAKMEVAEEDRGLSTNDHQDNEG